MTDRHDIPPLRLEVDFSRAEEYLKRAERSLDMGNPSLAKKEAERARREARGSLRKYRLAVEMVNTARRALERGDNLGYDVKDAAGLLAEAVNALNRREYLLAVQLAEKAIDRSNPPPETGEEIIIKTELRYDQGIYFYEVAVGNNYGHPIRNVKVTPQDFGALFVPDEESKTIRLLKSDQWETVTFILKPVNSDLSEFEFMPGRDALLQTTLSMEAGRLIYEVYVENLLDEPLIDLNIFPFEPEGYRADAREKVIESLNSHEKKSVVFRLFKDGEDYREVPPDPLVKSGPDLDRVKPPGTTPGPLEPSPGSDRTGNETPPATPSVDAIPAIPVDDAAGRIPAELEAVKDWNLPWEEDLSFSRDNGREKKRSPFS